MRTLFIEHREEINKIIGECKTCYLAMSDGGLPYVLPMNFALDGYSIILHSAQSGRMWETIKRNPNVYKKLAHTYLIQEDANNFLSNFCKRESDGFMYPTCKKVLKFVNYFFELQLKEGKILDLEYKKILETILDN